MLGTVLEIKKEKHQELEKGDSEDQSKEIWWVSAGQSEWQKLGLQCDRILLELQILEH